MALRGNLKDFSLPDVFQLVTFSRKTGVLRIARSDGADGTVWFRDGDVFFASSNWHSELLGERLVKAQRITAQALKRALELRSAEPEDGRRLGQILVDEGYITGKVLEAFVSEQIQETIFDLMRWDEGDFDFEAMPDVVDEDIGLTVSIENVVMEGSRRLEEWNRIRKKIPSMDVVFKMATAPGEGTFEISLKPIEWQLLLLIDGTRSVADLAVATNRTDFDVARIVYGLFSAGLLEFATEEEIEQNRAERADREAKLAELEAARKAEEAAAMVAAAEREARLMAEADARRTAEAQAAAVEAADAQAAAEAIAQAEAAAVEAARAARTEPEEEPEFLGGAAIAPSVTDQAVLEEFMGAVLEKPAPEVEPVPEPMVPAPEPYVPAEEPAFMSAGATEETELPLMPVSSVEDLLGIERAPAIEEPNEDNEEVVPEEPQPVEPLVPATEMEPVAGDESAATSDVEPSADFESELLFLGLGELPGDLLAPRAPEELATEAAEQFVIAPEAEAIEFYPAVEEPVQLEGVAPYAVEGIEFEAVAAPMSELPEVIEPAAPEPIDELAELVGSLELPAEVPTELVVEVLEEAEEPDFSELLESLDVDAEPAHPAVEPASPVEAGFDAELLREEPEEATTGGVISTDAFLEDISIDDLGFSGGLTDELSALTGVARKQPSRPQASVNTIPDKSTSMIKRDTRVDKDTLLKIIDGIKHL